MDEWDGDDNPRISKKKINLFDQKTVRREILNLLRKNGGEVSGPEAEKLFKDEFEEDFPYKNFGCTSMEQFLSRMRELNYNKETKRFLVVPEHKYVLFAEQAVGGKSMTKEVEKSAQEEESRHSQKTKNHQMLGNKEYVPFEGFGSAVKSNLENNTGNNTTKDEINNNIVPEIAVNAADNTQASSKITYATNGVYSDSEDEEKIEAPGVPQSFVDEMVYVNNHGGKRPMTGAGDAPIVGNQTKPRPAERAVSLDEEELKDFLPAPQRIPSFQELAKSNCDVLRQIVMPQVTEAPTGVKNTEKKTNPLKTFNKPHGNQHKKKTKGFDAMRTFLMEIFPSVGVKKQALFFPPNLRNVIADNPDIFEKTKEQGLEFVTSKKPVTELCEKGNRTIRNATVADLLWIHDGKCVIHEEEPCDLGEIVYFAEPDLIVCGTFYGCEKAERMTEIGGLLEKLVEEDALMKPKGFAPGNMYIAPLHDSYARVIIVGMSGQMFRAMVVDRPFVTHVSPGDLWQVPDEFKLSKVPGNLYLSRLRGCAATDFLKVSCRSKQEIKLMFTGRDENGIRFADFIFFNFWFTQTLSGRHRETMNIQQATAEFEIRKISEYFAYRGKYTDVMEPYNSRPAAVPNLFNTIDDQMRMIDRIKTKDEMSVLAMHMQKYLEGILPVVHVRAEEVVRAYRLMENLRNAAAFVPATTETNKAEASP